MSGDEVECQLCHRPVHSAEARARRVGSGCWRKLTPAQRRAIRQAPTVRARRALPVPDVDGQLPLDDEEPTPP
ncbi:DUF6011 domain-containing protein [Streptomyces sp. PAM3C]|uniref:DUF6011 domain-containing protein n=1 Tax=Streptomyces sp. PAM3C TaxID=2847300 RepID=UPI001C1E515C|nr:DUF6011 domain-containing protein [Streptomyces sp. PAM3C]MBU5946763.1 hypothetical protein [Streptomyces sp. PAM3C]